MIVTVLDYRYYDNNRVHHLVNQLQRRFREVVLVYKKAYIQGNCSGKEKLRGFFTFSANLTQQQNVTCIEVNPLLNHSTGLGLSILNLSGPEAVPGSALKKFFKKFLSLMGLLTEQAVLPSFLIAHLIRIKGKTDIFIGQGPWEVSFGLILRMLGRVKTVVYDDFDYAPGNQPVSVIRRSFIASLEKVCLKKADMVVSVGDFLAGMRKQQTGRKVTVIPNGADLSLFRHAQEKTPHVPTLVYMGFVYEWSGLELVFEALQKVKAKCPVIRLLIIGHTVPEYLAHLMNLRDSLGLEGNVQYLGKKSYGELVPFLKESDIGLAVFRPIELRKYAFSLKVIEYMAAGLPVITTAGTQSATVVKKHCCGEAVKFDAESIANCIIDMFSNHGKYSLYANNAKQASQMYDWSNLIYHQYYEAIRACYEGVYPGQR